MRYLQLLTLSVVLLMATTLCTAEEFPYRKDYPEVPVVELTDLKTGYDNNEFIIVDVRSKLEFDTIHPKDAVHIPMANALFEENLTSLAAINPGKKIATYCNGITCLKSYKAAQRAVEMGMTNVYAFDAGIPAWASAYPAETLLLGEEVADPKKQLIPKREFSKLCLDFEMFKLKSTVANTVVIDARDAIQRTENLPGLSGVKQIPLDKFIRNVVNRGVMKKKSLLIFDQVGKQVRWLMYHLVDNGYTDFHFLKGGATSVLKKQEYRDTTLGRIKHSPNNNGQDPALSKKPKLAGRDQ